MKFTKEETIKKVLSEGDSAITMEGARWIVMTKDTSRSAISAMMSSAQFIHLNQPVVAIQEGGRMTYFDVEGGIGYVTNLRWARANLEMVRLPGKGRLKGMEEKGENVK
jgi:hypothetical protein